MYDIFTYILVDFYGSHVGKYTMTMDPMGLYDLELGVSLGMPGVCEKEGVLSLGFSIRQIQ